MMEKLSCFTFPGVARDIEQRERPEDICTHKGPRANDGSVDMTLRGVVNYRFRLVFGKDRLYRVPVANVSLKERVASSAVRRFHIRQVLKIARIRQSVDVDDISAEIRVS
jgi:hypothetical protein